MRLLSQRKPAAWLLSFQLLTHQRLGSFSSSGAVACATMPTILQKKKKKKKGPY